MQKPDAYFFLKSNTYLGARFLCLKDPCKRNARVTELTFEVSCPLSLESGTTLVPESNLYSAELH